uniref:Uncharacterized protein n=1 Tax=Anguilla anguilla TaxID=7936 RepID=A0A0E9RVT4_ANGAN
MCPCSHLHHKPVIMSWFSWPLIGEVIFLRKLPGWRHHNQGL